jgi:hypothetical protein
VVLTGAPLSVQPVQVGTPGNPRPGGAVFGEPRCKEQRLLRVLTTDDAPVQSDYRRSLPTEPDWAPESQDHPSPFIVAAQGASTDASDKRLLGLLGRHPVAASFALVVSRSVLGYGTSAETGVPCRAQHKVVRRTCAILEV